MTYFESDGPNRLIDPIDDPFERLETILLMDEYRLKQLTASTEYLSISRLAHIDPELADSAEALASGDTRWPDDESAVAEGPAELGIEPFVGEDAEIAFIAPILSEGSTAYNNFFLNLKIPHQTASKSAAAECMARGDMLGMTYGTKPYIGRAYALMPDFMHALQQATEQTGSMGDWNDAMVEGHVDPNANYRQAVLLHASVYAYVLLARLMRSDDISIQKTMLGFAAPTVTPIVDPVSELRT